MTETPLAIFHSHLNPGGVIRVVGLQVQSLPQRVPDITLKGSPSLWLVEPDSRQGAF